jgi:hypothetical protein
MDEVTSRDKPYLNKSDFKREHNMSKNMAIQNFKDQKKMGGMEHSKQFLEKVSHFFFPTRFNTFLNDVE